VSDQPTNAAAQPGSPAAQPAQAQQIGSGLPDGYQPISKSDYERYQRYEQQVRGFTPLYEKLTKAGIKSVDDWGKYEPAIETFKSRKMDPRAFAASFSDEAERDLNGGTSQPQQVDLAKLREEMEQSFSTRIEERFHGDARKGDNAVVDAAINKILGEGDHDDFQKELTKRAVVGWLEENRPSYPDGHPLAGKYLAPLTPDLAEKAVAYYSGLRTKQAGADLANKAAQAAKPVQKVGTVGGGGGSTGKPNTTAQTPMEAKREKAEQVLAGIQARRAAFPK